MKYQDESDNASVFAIGAIVLVVGAIFVALFLLFTEHDPIPRGLYGQLDSCPGVWYTKEVVMNGTYPSSLVLECVE